MSRSALLILVSVMLAALCVSCRSGDLPAAKATSVAADNALWHISGDLSEACSCSVPCACNFGDKPSPHHFCWALWSLSIHQGHYGAVPLDGLHLAGGGGENGVVTYIDERATKEQADALRTMARTMYDKALKYYGITSPKAIPQDFRFLGYRTARIEQEVGDRKNRLKIGDRGAFESAYILGMDGKTPVVVENNWSWNIQHGIKGKTTQLKYKDDFGNHFDFKETNSNQGTFDWSDSTPIYYR